MARGAQRAGLDVTAMEMTKWFDTNYHYIVPEWRAGQRFRLASTAPFDALAEAQVCGIAAKPVLVGPLSLVLLGKAQDDGLDVLGETLDGVVAVYCTVIERLAAAGAAWIQFDEPCLAQDRTPRELHALQRAYAALVAHKGTARLCGPDLLRRRGRELRGAGGAAGRRDRTRPGPWPRQPRPAEPPRPAARQDSVAGVVDGRNVWRGDLAAALDLLDAVRRVVPGECLIVAPSCSLLHVPSTRRVRRGSRPRCARGWPLRSKSWTRW